MTTSLSSGRGLVRVLLSMMVCALAAAPAYANGRDVISQRARTRITAWRAPPVTSLPPGERRSAAVQRFLRNDGIRRCWTRQLLRDPTTTARRLTVGLGVDADGRIVQVRVRDPMAPSLATCIASTSFAVTPVGPGAPFDVEGTLNLERGD